MSCLSMGFALRNKPIKPPPVITPLTPLLYHNINIFASPDKNKKSP
jgi:hypothetical protein